MEKKEICSLQSILSVVRDPRQDKNKRHLLIDILLIAFCALLAGAEGFTDFAQFGRLKKAWFKRFLKLPFGIPSHDVFGKVFALLDPTLLQECFLQWMNSVRKALQLDSISIDGKTIRGSRCKHHDAVTMVSAWACEVGLVLAQMKVNSDSNEIPAVEDLLKLLEIKGCVITIDAIGCQTKVTTIIYDKGGDYILPAKDNQPKLTQAIEDYFLEASEEDFQRKEIKTYEKKEKNRGRQEYRKYWMSEDLSTLKELERFKEWKGLKSIAMVYRRREEEGKISEEETFYITSLKADAKTFARHVRNHWEIENKLHWRLDISFKEDQCRIRETTAVANIAILRHFGMNFLKKETSEKASLRSKIKRCGWDDSYLSNVLSL